MASFCFFPASSEILAFEGLGSSCLLERRTPRDAKWQRSARSELRLMTLSKAMTKLTSVNLMHTALAVKLRMSWGGSHFAPSLSNNMGTRGEHLPHLRYLSSVLLTLLKRFRFWKLVAFVVERVHSWWKLAGIEFAGTKVLSSALLLC